MTDDDNHKNALISTPNSKRYKLNHIYSKKMWVQAMHTCLTTQILCNEACRVSSAHNVPYAGKKSVRFVLEKYNHA